MVDREPTRFERTKKGAVTGAFIGAAIPLAALIATEFTHPEFVDAVMKNPEEHLKTIGLIFTFSTTFWVGFGALLEGYVFPEMDKKKAQLQSWLEEMIE